MAGALRPGTQVLAPHWTDPFSGVKHLAMVVRAFTDASGRQMVILTDGALRRWEVPAESVEPAVRRPPAT
jgi:hypothetical protein